MPEGFLVAEVIGYPRFVADEFAEITFVEDCGLNNEEVISCPPDQLPAGYADRRN
ncbi:phenolic acid decarboxylase [Rhizobium sp.]|uniref:phenolic acid decarboxylase n=1 Tax=Rhizobium sp. TaxID=391 RepID=UPI002AA685A7